MRKSRIKSLGYRSKKHHPQMETSSQAAKLESALKEAFRQVSAIVKLPMKKLTVIEFLNEV